MTESTLTRLSINHNQCPQGWIWAAETSKCYKAFPDKRPWPHAHAFCKMGNGNLAQPMYNSSWFAIIESINIRTEAKGNFWIGSRFSDQGYIWVNGSYNSYKNWEEKGGPISGIIEIFKYLDSLRKQFCRVILCTYLCPKWLLSNCCL